MWLYRKSNLSQTKGIMILFNCYCHRMYYQFLTVNQFDIIVQVKEGKRGRFRPWGKWENGEGQVRHKRVYRTGTSPHKADHDSHLSLLSGHTRKMFPSVDLLSKYHKWASQDPSEEEELEPSNSDSSSDKLIYKNNRASPCHGQSF